MHEAGHALHAPVLVPVPLLAQVPLGQKAVHASASKYLHAGRRADPQLWDELGGDW